MKAQASLDSLIMIGLGLVLAASFFFVANTILGDSISAAQAQEAVELISSEIKYVYSSGEGTVRFVDVTIPNGIEEINLDGNRVHMRVSLSSGLTDFYSNTPVKLVGSINATPGLERVTVRYLSSGNVQVGDLRLTATPKSMYFYLERGDGDSGEIVVTNNANFTINGIDSTLEGLSDMVVITSPASTLAPLENDTIDVTVSIPSDKPIGTYTGYVRTNSSNDGEDDVLISISVQGGSPTTCTLSPDTANLSLGQSQQFVSSCENAANESVPCPLMSWSSNAGNVIPIVSYSSTTLVATDSAGTYVNATAGFSCASSVTVSGIGPLVTALLVDPANPLITDSITVNATGDDTGRGDLNISMCQVRIDSESWQDMNASDGTYDEIVEDVTLNVGTLSAGPHSATVRCNNTDGKFGSQSTEMFTVNAGPLVTALFTTPASISAGDSITINATGDDSGSADDNISLCQVSVDGGAFADMSADDETYDEIAENVSLSIGPRSVGTHNATVKCNDSAGLIGSESTINFTVSPKSILFIHDGATMMPHETSWVDWFASHSSGEGYNWSYDTAQDSDVVSGVVNATDYKIVLMADYDTGAGIETVLGNYQTAGGIIVLVCDALQNGPQSLGYTASAAISDSENEIWIVNNSHYITNGFATGKTTVLSIAAEFWRTTDDLGGAILADGMKANKQETGEPALDDATDLITWGATEPDNFNNNGDTITTRILDYALNASTIG
jgi:hypothetical protein